MNNPHSDVKSDVTDPTSKSQAANGILAGARNAQRGGRGAVKGGVSPLFLSTL